jgi:hypothetical protein
MARCPAHGNRIQLNPSRAVNLFGATPQPDCRRTVSIKCGLLNSACFYFLKCFHACCINFLHWLYVLS